ncbi:MAG: hypothetical protein J0H65_10610, partial [Rhizobiales bacterium]|nr:hypothetical protein [Hyphomicrobiales bacterium]
VDAEAVSEEVGAASTRAQLHSLLVKGVAATLVDVLWAAEVLGDDAGAHAEILRWFEEASAASAQALLRDTAEHHKTRQLELTDVSEMLAEAGYEPTMTDGIGLTHSRLLHSRKIPHAR